MRVLIVDDQKAFAEAVAMALTRWVEEVHIVGAALTGLQAMELVREHRPDVVLLDLLLPGLNGIQVAHRISTEVPETKIIFITGCDDAGLIRQAVDFQRGLLEKGGLGMRDLAGAVCLTGKGYRVVPEGLLGGPLASIPVQQRLPRGVAATADGWSSLTTNEYTYLQLVSDGLDTPQICNVLGKKAKTLSNYRSSIIHKLNVPTWCHAVVLFVKTFARP